MSGTVLAVSCRALVDYASARNYETGHWLRTAGVTSVELEEPETRLEPNRVFQLWRAAYDDLGDPALALHVAESLPRGAYRGIEYLAAHAPTIGQAYSKLADYFSVIDATTDLRVELVGERVSLGPRTTNADPSLYPAIEYMLAACYLRVRDMTGTVHAPIEVELASPTQPHASEVARVFRSPVRWNASHNRLWFTREVWSSPTQQADPALMEVLERHAQMLQEKYPRAPSLLEALDQLLDETWGNAEPTLRSLARRLAVSSRTLQRRLTEEGTGFAERVDDSRRRATLKWLRCPDVSLAEVAYLVGFKEQASLTRAVRRWTGKTPGQVRRDG
jgi:AraC-like DNA-binding protein